MLKRFIKTYPYITKPTSLPPILQNFPISFSSSPTHQSPKFEVHPSHNHFSGILQVFELLLTSIANNTLSNLEGALEHNFLQNLNSSLKDLSSHGYKLRLAGDIKKTKIFLSTTTVYTGAVLPFRNLMLPASEYKIYSFRSISESFGGYLLSVPNKDWVRTNDYDNFKHVDFEQINKNGGKNSFQKMEAFFKVETGILMQAQDEEFLVESEFRLMVLDGDGKVVSGNEEDRVEMHCGILETFTDISGTRWFYKQMLKDAQDFYAKILDGYLNQQTLIDFDGFMQGNPPVPKDLLEQLKKAV